MKKRIGKINTDIIVFSNTDKTAEELLEGRMAKSILGARRRCHSFLLFVPFLKPS